jgi:hypothetical protein
MTTQLAMTRSFKSNRRNRLMVLDPENLACSPVLRSIDVLNVCVGTNGALSPRKGDVVLVGAHHGNSGSCGFIAKYFSGMTCLQSGQNGAELALQRQFEQIPRWRFGPGETQINECIIGSGDHFFVELATEMKALGIPVTVMSQPHARSRDLSLAADYVIDFGTSSNEIYKIAA